MGKSITRDLLVPGPFLGVAGEPRDIQMKDGKLWVYEGDFGGKISPLLRSYDVATSKWQKFTWSPWTTGGNTAQGNVGVVGNYVFVDSAHPGLGSIVRLDSDTGQTAGINSVPSYDLSVGLDGLLYSLEGGFTAFSDGHYEKKLHVYDPQSLHELRTVSLMSWGYAVTVVTVDSNSDIFAAGTRTDTVYHYDRNGNVLNSGSMEFLAPPNDIELSPDGQIAMGTGIGYVVLTNRSLSHFTRFQVPSSSSSENFVSFGSIGPTGLVRGRVFNDLNPNGVRDPGDPPLAGYRIYVDLDDDGHCDLAEPRVRSGADGYWELANISSGSHRIRMTAVSGSVTTTPAAYTISLGASGTNTKNFGISYASLVGGRVYVDAKKNGVLNSVDAGAPGFRLFVDLDRDGLFDPGEPFTRSDDGGYYQLGNLAPGSYLIRRTSVSGWTATSPLAIELAISATSMYQADFGITPT